MKKKIIKTLNSIMQWLVKKAFIAGYVGISFILIYSIFFWTRNLPMLYREIIIVVEVYIIVIFWINKKWLFLTSVIGEKEIYVLFDFLNLRRLFGNMEGESDFEIFLKSSSNFLLLPLILVFSFFGRLFFGKIKYLLSKGINQIELEKVIEKNKSISYGLVTNLLTIALTFVGLGLTLASLSDFRIVIGSQIVGITLNQHGLNPKNPTLEIPGLYLNGLKKFDNECSAFLDEINVEKIGNNIDGLSRIDNYTTFLANSANIPKIKQYVSNLNCKTIDYEKITSTFLVMYALIFIGVIIFILFIGIFLLAFLIFISNATRFCENLWINLFIHHLSLDIHK